MVDGKAGRARGVKERTVGGRSGEREGGGTERCSVRRNYVGEDDCVGLVEGTAVEDPLVVLVRLGEVRVVCEILCLRF